MPGCDPKAMNGSMYNTWGNTYYTPQAQWSVSCGGKEYTMQEWQAAGQDKGAKVLPYPSADDAIAMVRKKLGL